MTKPITTPKKDDQDVPIIDLLTDSDKRDILNCANDIVADTGWGRLTVEFRDGEIHMIETTIARLNYHRTKQG